MRIKKTSQTTPIQAQIVDGYSESTTDGYSANYVNNAIKDVYSTNEVKTNKVWIDGKPIYRKVIVLNESSTTGNYVQHNISNIDNVITSFITIYDNNNYLTSWTRTDNNSCISVTFSPTRYYIFKSSSLTIYKGWIIAEYTKTTD